MIHKHKYINMQEKRDHGKYEQTMHKLLKRNFSGLFDKQKKRKPVWFEHILYVKMVYTKG